MDTNVDPCECLLMPNTEDLPEDWSEMSQAERDRWFEDIKREARAIWEAESSREDVARYYWENS